MTFTMVIPHLRTGGRCRLSSWPQKCYIEIEGDRILEFLYGGLEGDDWCPSLEDLSSRKWEILA
jgi:hypothetical protein